MEEGTRFKLSPQFDAEGLVGLETVWISTPAGKVGPGPSDSRMYAVYPAGPKHPYGISADPATDSGVTLPPWTGAVLPPAMPGPGGHFDHLTPGTPQFEMAHAFGTARFVIDVWEDYFERPIRWQFQDQFERMEVSILPALDNAHAGYGFIELGQDRKTGSRYSLNFDVIAHEIGHSIIYAEVGMPDPGAETGEYFGFQESAGDLVALVTSMHFETLVDDLLLATRGNLYALNSLNRMAELSSNEQIRNAANDRTLSEFARGWRNEHDLSAPLTGAFFDIFVDIFHEFLVENRLIATRVEELSDLLLATPAYGAVLQRQFDRAFARDPDGFKTVLLAARDTLGSYLAATWQALDRNWLDYTDVADAFEAVDIKSSGGRFQRLIRGNFDMRDIGHVRVGPQLGGAGG